MEPTTQASTQALTELIAQYPPLKAKKCRTTTRSGCRGSITAWGEWVVPDGAWAFMMPYRQPIGWRCDICGHWMMDEGNQEDVLQVTRGTEVIWQSPKDKPLPPK